MATQETLNETAVRYGWRYDGLQDVWVRNTGREPGRAIHANTAYQAVELSMGWEREARELRRRKLPLWHWGADIGNTLESIPYG